MAAKFFIFKHILGCQKKKKKIQSILLLNHTQMLLHVYRIMILKIRLQMVLEEN